MISIHALLAESDHNTKNNCIDYCISIHALLAESDLHCKTLKTFRHYFYPRSPCGERLKPPIQAHGQKHFYPRSPCGERRCLFCVRLLLLSIFLSTLSLRRATVASVLATGGPRYFYPRSPCGERRVHYDNYNLHCVISIHALLAESDLASRLADMSVA